MGKKMLDLLTPELTQRTIEFVAEGRTPRPDEVSLGDVHPCIVCPGCKVQLVRQSTSLACPECHWSVSTHTLASRSVHLVEYVNEVIFGLATVLTLEVLYVEDQST